ncbi:MAG: excinuclease ABC subunit UvrC, partial [Clostridia bacterium]|nr:excinuclease ABC subunit UvrC [Clostridia bacterium]
MFDFEAKLKTLPEAPGVYIMHDKDDNIIYVGKAKILKNRVRSYFKTNNHPPKVAAMVANVAYFEYIIADSELEALVLENNLIKKHMPKYNILLKDDKTYPFIKITMNEDFPRIMITRQVKRDGARYFGPYQSGLVLRELVELVRDIFMLRCCTKQFDGDFKTQKPCLYYHIGKCMGVCAKNVSKEEYRAAINEVCSFLNGKFDKVYKKLNDEMNAAAQKLDFEKAALLRDRINSVTQLGEKQKIVTANGTDIDAMAVYNANNIACVEVFFIRNGNIIGKEHYFVNDTDGMDNGSILSDFVRQYYDSSSFLPKELMLQNEIEDDEVLGSWLTEKAGRNVYIRYPKIGKYVELMRMIEINAKKEHSEYELKRMRASDFVNNAISQLMKLLSMENPPMLIEAYDISNISGDSNVGAMVTFKNGKPYKQGYRNFKIKNVEGQNDYASMKEVLTRRFTRAKAADDSKFAELPDVVFVDGGSAHVDCAVEVFGELCVDIPVFGIVKDDNHNTRGLVSPDGEIPIDSGSDAF